MRNNSRSRSQLHSAPELFRLAGMRSTTWVLPLALAALLPGLSLHAQTSPDPEPETRVSFELNFVQLRPGARAALAARRTKAHLEFESSDAIRVHVLDEGFDARAEMEVGRRPGQVERLGSHTIETEPGKAAFWLIGRRALLPTQPDPLVEDDGIADGPAEVFRVFGIKLRFVPFLLSDGRLWIRVEPRVEGIDFERARSRDGRLEPSLSMRGSTEWVFVKPGQSIAITGLVTADTVKMLRRIPGVANRRAVASLLSRFSRRDGSELVLVVTPTLLPGSAATSSTAASRVLSEGPA